MPAVPRAPRRPPDIDAEDIAAEGPSKSQLKREMLELQALGEAVSALPESRLADLPIAERLRDAIAELHRTRSHEGRRRQVQYIGKLMRFEDPLPLREAVAAFKLGSARDTLALHEAEYWRDQLLASDDALSRWIESYPGTDTQQLRSLLRSARKETLAEGARHGRAYRDLFQLVKQRLALESTGAQDAAPVDEPTDPTRP